MRAQPKGLILFLTRDVESIHNSPRCLYVLTAVERLGDTGTEDEAEYGRRCQAARHSDRIPEPPLEESLLSFLDAQPRVTQRTPRRRGKSLKPFE